MIMAIIIIIIIMIIIIINNGWLSMFSPEPIQINPPALLSHLQHDMPAELGTWALVVFFKFFTNQK